MPIQPSSTASADVTFVLASLSNLSPLRLSTGRQRFTFFSLAFQGSSKQDQAYPSPAQELPIFPPFALMKCICHSASDDKVIHTG
jgi:hypothetical protein